MKYFVTMTVEARSGFSHTQKHGFHEALEAFPGDTVENLYWRAWNRLAKDHRFDAATGVVIAWDFHPVVQLGPPLKCGMPPCKNPAREDTRFCDGHSR